ncbi:MarC family protein [Vibrio mediterranei]|uniref:MarC family protein n=1 Tax=Vibrio mediterranei TaxID=689 RepID=UPI001EFCDD72|nr:MarC family protein [Vibrio mediterranei]MCG9627107.1 MarC family protein [Vibrio mediterranei]
MGTLDIVTLLLATMGPMKVSIVFSKYAVSMTKEEQKAVAIKTVLVAASICVFFVLGGSVLLSLFHIDTASLNIAGGIILFLYAIQMVMGDDKGDSDDNVKPSKSIAISPLAMPFMATPQALVAITTISADMASLSGELMLVVIIVAIALLNLLVMLNIKRVMDFIGVEIIQIIAKIAGILLTALAMQMILSGVADGLKILGLVS